MTFMEELKVISDKYDFEARLDAQCKLIKEGMKSAASNGYRTYQVEIVKPVGSYASSTTPDNYKIIICDKERVINDYSSKIIHYFKNLGFSLANMEFANIHNNYYVSTQITIHW